MHCISPKYSPFLLTQRPSEGVCALHLQFKLKIAWEMTYYVSVTFKMCNTHKDFDCLKLQICKSIIYISISYLFAYSNLIRNNQYWAHVFTIFMVKIMHCISPKYHPSWFKDHQKVFEQGLNLHPISMDLLWMFQIQKEWFCAVKVPN